MTFNLKDYEPVEDRLRLFWEEHPYGRVITELLHHADGHYIVQASVYVGNELRNDPPVATGLAHDSEEQLPPNMRTSALEVCETSAIGRALANMGYAAKGKRPSREEMQKASWGAATAPQVAPDASLAATSGAERPPAEYGEGSPGGTTSGEVEPDDRGGLQAPSPDEPHDHVKGKQLASGSWLCSFEFPDGRICGQKFKPKPTVYTEPVQERADIA